MRPFLTFAILGIGLTLMQNRPAEAMTVTDLDLTGGGSTYGGRFHRVLDRVLDLGGTIVIGEYQPTPQIVPPVAKGHRTFSLFTSGVQGAAPPSAMISGSSITVDLSSLFFGVSRGDSLRAWNIGGLASGVFNPETLEFCISWQHLFDHPRRDRLVTFFLQGKVEFAPQPIPIPASLLLYATGMFGAAIWIWRRRMASS